MGTTPTTGTEIVSRNMADIEETLNNSLDQVAMVLPKHIDPLKVFTVLMEVIRGETKLKLCTPASILTGLLEASDLGLLFGKHLGHAHLVPFHNGELTRKYGHDVYEAEFWIGYRGIIHLVTEPDPSAIMRGELIFEGDDFARHEGTERVLIHTPGPGPYNLENYIAAYSVLLTDRKKDFEWMSRDEIEGIRRRSKGYNIKDGPHQNSPLEMVRKTPLRRHGKRLDIAPKIIAALVRDEYRELGVEHDQPERPRLAMPRRMSLSATTPSATQPAASQPPQTGPVDYSQDTPPPCKTCGGKTDFKAAGTKKDGNPYPAFWGCRNYKTCKGGGVNAKDWHEELAKLQLQNQTMPDAPGDASEPVVDNPILDMKLWLIDYMKEWGITEAQIDAYVARALAGVEQSRDRVMSVFLACQRLPAQKCMETVLGIRSIR